MHKYLKSRMLTDSQWHAIHLLNRDKYIRRFSPSLSYETIHNHKQVSRRFSIVTYHRDADYKFYIQRGIFYYILVMYLDDIL